MSRGHDDVPAVRSTERITFLCPLPPHGLRRNTQYRSPQALGRLKDEYSIDVVLAVWAAYGGALLRWQPSVRGRVRYTWRYAGVRPDPGNVPGNVKYLQDILCVAPRLGSRQAARYKRWHLGLFEDDSELEAAYKLEKVRQKADEGVWVELERLSE